MAGFQVANFDFGQNIENNRIRRQQLAQQAAQANQQAALQARGQDIQRENAEANRALEQQRMDESARQFDAQQAQREKAFAADQKWKAWNADLSERTQALQERHSQWEDALNQQKMEQSDQQFEAQMDAMRIAREKSQMELDEQIENAKKFKEFMDDTDAQAILAVEQGGYGGLSQNELAVLNARLKEKNPDDPGFDGYGTFVEDPNTHQRIPIGDGKTLYRIFFERDEKGNVRYGKDKTPIFNAIPVDEGMRQTVLHSARGQYYLTGKDPNGSVYGRGNTTRGASSTGTRGGLTYEQQKDLAGVRKGYEQKRASAMQDSILRMKYEGTNGPDGNYMPNYDKPRKLDEMQTKRLAAMENAYEAYVWNGMLGDEGGQGSGAPAPGEKGATGSVVRQLKKGGNVVGVNGGSGNVVDKKSFDEQRAQNGRNIRKREGAKDNVEKANQTSQNDNPDDSTKKGESTAQDNDFVSLQKKVDEIGISFRNVKEKFKTLTPEQKKIWWAYVEANQKHQNDKTRELMENVGEKVGKAWAISQAGMSDERD